MLIEADKRGNKNSLALAYSTSDDEQFYVPANVFLLGMMNTADRSLALVDYALRRRFAFVNLEPLFGSSTFVDLLEARGTDPVLAKAVAARLMELNQTIAEEHNLGPGFRIGHSYFCRGEARGGSSIGVERVSKRYAKNARSESCSGKSWSAATSSVQRA